MFNNQELFEFIIISSNLITLVFDSGVILLWEITYLSLLRINRLPEKNLPFSVLCLSSRVIKCDINCFTQGSFHHSCCFIKELAEFSRIQYLFLLFITELYDGHCRGSKWIRNIKNKVKFPPLIELQEGSIWLKKWKTFK